MRYYVYFDSYRRPRAAVSEEELIERYGGSQDDFLTAMGSRERLEKAVGHVGILNFADQGELNDFLERTGEEITGFYECEDGSRPYNF